MEIANLTKEFFNDGTVAIDICESEFNSGKDLNQNAHKLAYEVGLGHPVKNLKSLQNFLC